MVIDVHRQYYILCVYYFYSYTYNYDNLGNIKDRIERYKAYYPTPYRGGSREKSWGGR